MKIVKPSTFLLLLFLFIYIGTCWAQNADPYYDRGIEYGTQGKFEKAQEQFQKALEIEPNHSPSKRCLRLLEATVESKVNKQTAIHLFTGILYANKGILDETIAEFKKALSINPRYADAHYNLGLAYQMKGMVDEAIFEYKQTLAIDPGYSEAHYVLADHYYSKKEYKLAIKHFDKASELGYPVEPEFLQALEAHR